MATDIITLDPEYDRTLIVGSISDPHGQKRFRVNTKIFKLASAVWRAMFGGNFAESTQDEVKFPEDCSYAFHIALLIAHFKPQDLPEEMSRADLKSLAILSDKYRLVPSVGHYVVAKGWLQPHKDAHGRLKPFWNEHYSVALRDWIPITATFELKSDYEFLLNILAMEAERDDEGAFIVDEPLALSGNPIPECYDIEEIVDDDNIIDRIVELREKILESFVTAAHKALESEISNGSQIVSLDNRLTDWQAKKIGFITLEFKALRLYPASDATVEMYGSISYYRSRMCELDRVLKGFAKQPESRSKAKTRCDVTVSYANELDLAVTEHTEKGFLDVWSKGQTAKT